jgi:hypothetical protein
MERHDKTPLRTIRGEKPSLDAQVDSLHIKFDRLSKRVRNLELRLGGAALTGLVIAEIVRHYLEAAK